MIKNKKNGFTLIELLVVVAIIGVLSSVVLASLGEARSSARDTKRIADLKQIQTALELYYNENNNYPGEAGWCDSSKNVTGNGCPEYNSDGWPNGGLKRLEQGGHIAELPIDPINDTDFFYAYEPICGQTHWGKTCSLGSCCGYKLGAVLENSNESSCIFNSIPQNYCVEGGI